MTVIAELLTGPVSPLGPAGAPSGINKSPVDGLVRFGREGLTGDAQGDRTYHGGPDKAVHHYPFDHYPQWRRECGALALLERPGAFGENVSTCGLTESDVAIGDVYRAGGALLEVSQGRQPCWKLNLRFERPTMSQDVQAGGRTGWYYRVLEEGDVERGDTLTLVDRPCPEWTIARLIRAFYVDPLDRTELEAMTALDRLPERWRATAAKRLETGVVEDWTLRLHGPADARPSTPTSRTVPTDKKAPT